jgi:hypothetical protein
VWVKEKGREMAAASAMTMTMLASVWFSSSSRKKRSRAPYSVVLRDAEE